MVVLFEFSIGFGLFATIQVDNLVQMFISSKYHRVVEYFRTLNRQQHTMITISYERNPPPAHLIIVYNIRSYLTTIELVLIPHGMVNFCGVRFLFVVAT